MDQSREMMLSSNESGSRWCGHVSFMEDNKIYINILVADEKKLF